jgi:hypothetical protein
LALLDRPVRQPITTRVTVLAVMLLAGAASPTFAQRALSTVRPPDAIDRAQGMATRPMPTLPDAPTPAERWVPERRVFSPELRREIVVPGHYERVLSDTQSRVPPLHGVIPEEGRTVVIPGGDRPPAEIRGGP